MCVGGGGGGGWGVGGVHLAYNVLISQPHSHRPLYTVMSKMAGWVAKV